MAADLRLPASAVGLIVLLAFASGCSEQSDPPEPATVQTPTVVTAEATRQADGSWRFDVTVSSPYDSPAQYADAWRILGPDDTEYGIRELLHDHAGEQPFTRSLSDVVVPDGVSVVRIQARDSDDGWALSTFELELP